MKKTSLIALAPACLLLGACGSSGAPQNAATKDPDAARVRFAQCMRKAGIDVATSDSGGGIRIRVPRAINPARMDKIQKDCFKTSGMPQPQAPSPAMQQEAQDNALKFAACMRAHGVNMPDPQFSGGKITMMIQKSVNPSLPRVQNAQKACEKLNPMMKGGPGAVKGSQSDSGSSGGAVLSAP